MKILTLNIITCSLLLAAACSTKTDTKKVSPASIENPVKESDLTTLKLTAKAVERLGIKSQAIVEKQANQTRTYSGEISAVPGQSMTMTAPVSGTVLGLKNSQLPVAGSPVSKGQVMTGSI